MKRALLSIASLVFLIGCVHGPLKHVFPKAVRDPYTSLIDSDFYSFEGKYKKSIEKLEESLRSSPDSAYLHYMLAERYAEAQAWDAATAELKTVLHLNARWARAEKLLGQIDQLQDKHTEAIGLFEDVIRQNPEQEEAYLYLSQCYVNKKNYQKALEVLKRLVGVEPESVNAYYYIGSIQSSYLKQTAEAIRTYRKILEWEPGNAKVRHAIAQIYMDGNKSKEALAEYLELEKMAPADLSVELQVALLYYDRGDFAKASERFQNILKQNPEADRIRYYLGMLYEKQKKSQEAMEAYQKIPPSSGLYKEARLRLSYLLNQAHKDREAIAVLEEAKVHVTEASEVYEFLAFLWEEVGDLGKAEGVLRQGIEKLPDAEKLHFNLGILYDRKEKYDAAVQSMQEVLRVNPNNASALNYIGYTYAEQGIQLEEAKKFVEKALQLKPNDGYILDSLGWIYFKKGDLENASLYVRRALSHVPSEPAVCEHMGDIYLQKKELGKAIEYYKKALSLGEKRETPNPKELKRVGEKIRALAQ